MGVEPRELSLLSMLYYVKSGQGLDPSMIDNGAKGAQHLKFDEGAGQVSVRLAEKIGSDRVLLGDCIRNISQTSDGVTLVAESGKHYKGKQVVVAVPPNMCSAISFEPALPPAKSQLFQRMPLGYYTKVFFGGSLLIDASPTRLLCAGCFDLSHSILEGWRIQWRVPII
jgi:monoamine oxidase